MSTIPIYTIGYGGRSIEEFIALLQQYNIKFLIDVRSHPYSRSRPDYTKDTLENKLKQHHIRYIFMGDNLGGRPNDSTCYLDGKVDYASVREKPFYQKGIDHLRSAWDRQLHVAIMCSEAKPQECHRGKLIGNTLSEQHIEVAHIDETGNIKTQPEINDALAEVQLSLFDEDPVATALKAKKGFSRKKYSPAQETE